MTILICDDEDSVLRVLCRIFGRHTRVEKVLGFQRAEEVLAALVEHPYAHLVTDYHLSADNTGCDLIRHAVSAGYVHDRVAVVSGGIVEDPLACAGRTVRLWGKPLKLNDCDELVRWLAGD